MQGFLDGTREDYETFVNKFRYETRVVFNDAFSLRTFSNFQGHLFTSALHTKKFTRRAATLL